VADGHVRITIVIDRLADCVQKGNVYTPTTVALAELDALSVDQIIDRHVLLAARASLERFKAEQE
jgi:ribosome-interacting GTPase 1